ncbi:MAG: hypothetical protein GY781_15200 [Gammaproteobacteria bacterium]|nr:hypothetical protein [Gammaproteobacteria bacterium]
MKLQDQIDTIQAFKDGRTVTYISMYDCTPTRVYDRHSFDFVRNTYTVESLYKRGEIIMVRPEEVWWPKKFIEMDGKSAVCANEPGGFGIYQYHRKLTAYRKGEA